VAYILEKLGNLQLAQKKYKEAEKYYMEALNIYTASNPDQIYRCKEFLGNLYASQADNSNSANKIKYQKNSLDYLQEALKLYEQRLQLIDSAEHERLLSKISELKQKLEE
jgi:tetratricopeptide (TPR) repeat protein